MREVNDGAGRDVKMGKKCALFNSHSLSAIPNGFNLLKLILFHPVLLHMYVQCSKSCIKDLPVACHRHTMRLENGAASLNESRNIPARKIDRANPVEKICRNEERKRLLQPMHEIFLLDTNIWANTVNTSIAMPCLFISLSLSPSLLSCGVLVDGFNSFSIRK